MQINGMSLFCSAGIGELNIHNKGVNFVLANELVERRANMYRFFYPNTRMIQGDITNEEVKNEILEVANKNKVEFLLATPPCQGLSSVGKNKKQKHFEKDNRNFLIFEVSNFINELNLNYILIENVPRFLEMLFPYKGELLLLEDILIEKYSRKYNIESKILNAKDYGVAQSRPRAIIKMFKKGLNWSWPEQEQEISLREVIGDLPSLEPGEKSNFKWHEAKTARPQIIECLRHTKTGTSAIANDVYYPKKDNGERIKGFHNTYKRMTWDEPAPARTTYNGSISSHNNVHPGRLLGNGTYSDPRVLSLLETFLVSSISSDIEFPENASDTFIRTLIGEAIPPKLLEKICFPNGGDSFAK